jgi:hypothetical protein
MLNGEICVNQRQTALLKQSTGRVLTEKLIDFWMKTSEGLAANFLRIELYCFLKAVKRRP